MAIRYNPEYRGAFNLRKKVVTRIKRLTRPLMLTTRYGREFRLARPLRLRNMLQAWNSEREESVFKILGYRLDGIIICSQDDPTDNRDIPWANIPLEDLIRLENLVRDRRDKGLEVPIKLPAVKPLVVSQQANVQGQSIVSASHDGIGGTIMFGHIRNAGFFYFKREDVRLCAKHAAPFQPLQPAFKTGHATSTDVPARCPWCTGGELAKYWGKYPSTMARMALMEKLDRLLPEPPKRQEAA